MKNLIVIPLVSAGLLACQSPPLPMAQGTGETSGIRIEAGRCIAYDITPAVVETTTQDILVSPAEIDPIGNEETPAVFRTETRQVIVQERREVSFETPCPPVMDAPFVASLQRALKARGHFRGDVDGLLNARTGEAIRSFQHQNGLNSTYLSLESARQLGLIV